MTQRKTSSGKVFPLVKTNAKRPEKTLILLTEHIYVSSSKSILHHFFPLIVHFLEKKLLKNVALVILNPKIH